MKVVLCVIGVTSPENQKNIVWPSVMSFLIIERNKHVHRARKGFGKF